jgi:transcriptional regulator GlxA family with amidase domain
MPRIARWRRRAARRIIVFAAPPIEELDVVGPWGVFTTANSVVGGPAYYLQLVTAGKQRTIVGDSRLLLVADLHYNEVKGRIDTLLVPGGTGPRVTRDRILLSWVRSAAARARRVASVCTGAYLLAAAGLLDGKEATTHWNFIDDFAAMYPRIATRPDPIYVRDGRVYTSAGVTAGIDLALALVEDDLGSAVALRVAQALVVFLRRPGGQRQFSVVSSSESLAHNRIRELQVWMAEHLEMDLSVESLASRAAMSVRNFARVFAREVGVTPAHYVEQLRVEGARRELELGANGLEAVAESCGFHSGEVMRRAFFRRLGIPPADYRRRFMARSTGRRNAQHT